MDRKETHSITACLLIALRRSADGVLGSRGLVAIVCSTLASLLAAQPASAEPPTLREAPQVARSGMLRVDSPVNQPGTVVMYWSGPIVAPMHDRIKLAFDAYARTRIRFILVIHSGGGAVSEGEKVIALLQRIRQTHRFDTVVNRGGVCGSMCVPIYLQGQTRYGARTSSWLFHEITRRGTRPFASKKVEGQYTALIERYWIPAGVSRAWIDRMLPLAEGHDYWQTGHELITDRANIIMQPIENRVSRNLEPDDTVPAATLQVPPQVSTQVPAAPAASSASDKSQPDPSGPAPRSLPPRMRQPPG